MLTLLTVLIGRAVGFAARMRGGGSALPGLVVERLSPHFMREALAQLPMGVAVISGTNGKTTTTKIVAELLRSQGLRVFTNPSGSNFTRGVTSALLGAVSLKGRLSADVAVLELDEAHAVRFVQEVAPRYAVLLNVLRDQLDRFGEIDKTTGMLRTVALATTREVILNREDPRVAAIAEVLGSQRVRYFGLGQDLLREFPSDDDLYADVGSPSFPPGVPAAPAADVVVTAMTGSRATYRIADSTVTTELRLLGSYNAFNAAAALSLVRAICGDDTDPQALVASLSSVAPAFGRGETITVGGAPVELVLVKNPAGFRLALASLPSTGYATMIAINDSDADGRDVSWLWDVDFSSLQAVSMASGARAQEMALRLEYDEVPLERVDPRLDTALRSFITSDPGSPKRIYCTYTAMLALRRPLTARTALGSIA
jgi:UDP-N-acetylmuramyl tripeptide synthase